jgi:small subunit ribosomal protein S6
MTLPAPTYDLVLMLDPQAEESARTKILADTRTTIGAQGELLRDDDWGERALTYPIDKKPNAEYHLLQFHAASSELLDGLDRTLRITDGVMRFRIIKLAPGVPEAPEMGASTPVALPAEPEQPATAEEPAVEQPAAVDEPAAAVEQSDETPEGAVAEPA